MVCGRVMWSLKSRIYLRLKADTWNQLPAVGFFSSSDNWNDCNTEANPRSLLTKGCESLTVNYQMSIWALLEMESVDLVFNPRVHTKTNQCDRRYQILGGIYILANVQSCAFSKNWKKRKKKSWSPLLWRERSHTGSWLFVRPASWDAGHALVPDGLLCSMFRWCSGPCAGPPASDRSSSSPTKTGVKAAFVRTGLEGGGNGARPPWQRHHPSYRLCSLVTVFIIFGYKVIQLKGSDWNKAMWEERGVQCMMGGASRCRLLLVNGCGKKREVRIWLKRRGRCGSCWTGDLLSCVGRGFFSWVSVFFSLDLSKLATSETSGLSLIVADLQVSRQAWILGVLRNKV